MKTRTGFVSNSSSSSFIVLGAEMTTDQMWDLVFSNDETRAKMFEVLTDNDELKEQIEEFAELTLTLENVHTQPVLNAIAEYAYDWDLMYQVPMPKGLDVHQGDTDCCDGVVIGYHVCSMGYGIEDLTNSFATAETHREEIEEFFKNTNHSVGFYSLYTGY